MASRKVSAAGAGPGSVELPHRAFHDAERTASALRRALTAVYDVHGAANSAEVLAPLLHELAQIAQQRGIDVCGLVDAAVSDPDRGTHVPEPTEQPRRRRNARLFHALTRACTEMLELSRSEREQDAMSEELFRLMLGAGVYEDLTASPRDPERHLTAALPRDAVLGLMYLLASRRQFAEEFLLRGEQAELREHLRDELERLVETLRALGCNADLDAAMGFGIALWSPDEHDHPQRGLCFTFGRSVTDPHAADFVIQFEATSPSAAMRAADTVYRAHLAQRRRPRDEYIDLHGILFEQHLLHRGEVTAAFHGSPVAPEALQHAAPRLATLAFAESATGRMQRARFVPVGEGDLLHGSAGRHTHH